MPVVNDFPETIYVRDINEEQGEAFAEIKKKFNLTSNNEVVKTLFHKYLILEAERDDLQSKYRNLRKDYSDQQTKLDLVKETFLMMKSL